ncbi:UDP-N-acetylmuramoyl-L-alanyl-D-glutamate--2,6-diaminopimelate ligase [Acidicapsa acidisoli]|uniref:UDP-N-acetylmuramoyl-L-alanyl-D-glutamate--2, 6-diaminopimelate ligase n=1 Tax=Acidicapsa acidisoli TaxID=1615681 RepID=UPI0021E0B05E|nr:UDP-N-acetylmuramoyl-L-alanyl-D-glutamate--2,6-diaminopimelate ligase [Acidicapsa acidisoli]
MQWNELIRDVTAISRGPISAENAISEITITGIEYDSRRVGARSVFVAMRGGTTDGNLYIDTAIRQGAAGIVTDSPEAFAQLAADDPKTPRLLVEHGRPALAQLASAFFEHPERKLRATGVTGTNGKTTTAFLIESLLNAAARSSILVGTIEYHVAGEVRPSAHTTPESRDLFELMADGANRGATELVMEVSSHALDQGRVTGIGFDVAVFTNLTRDHLDYHGTMEQYFAAKRLLFDGTKYPFPRVAVLNAGDPYFPALAQAAAKASSQVVTYGVGIHADWRADDVRLTPAGAEFSLASPFGSTRIKSGLAGEVNVLNLLAALAAANARDVPFDQLANAIPTLKPVPGRFQPVDAGQPFTAIVDYAHTDDALRNLTALAHQLIAGTQGRVITLFGCGGDRDRTKRPKMGQAAGEGSDFVVVTSDNPRSEDPEAIIAEILPGLAATGTRYIVEADRTRAIALALTEATPGDVVLLAGKGHEKEQILRRGTIFFDDAEVALSALRALGYGGGR